MSRSTAIRSTALRAALLMMAGPFFLGAEAAPVLANTPAPRVCRPAASWAAAALPHSSTHKARRVARVARRFRPRKR